MAVEKVEIPGVILELHCQFSPFGPFLLWIGWFGSAVSLAGSSKTTPRILIFSMAMGADYSFELISIETYTPQFNGDNKSFLGSVSALRNFTTVVMLITFFSDLLLLPFLAGVVVLLITCTESWSAISRLLLPLSARWFFDRGCWFEAEEPPLFRGWLFTVLSRLFCICSISKAALLSTLCFSEYLFFVCVQKNKTWQKTNIHTTYKKTNVCTLWIQLHMYLVAVCWLLGTIHILRNHL